MASVVYLHTCCPHPHMHTHHFLVPYMHPFLLAWSEVSTYEVLFLFTSLPCAPSVSSCVNNRNATRALFTGSRKYGQYSTDQRHPRETYEGNFPRATPSLLCIESIIIVCVAHGLWFINLLQLQFCLLQAWNMTSTTVKGKNGHACLDFRLVPSL